MVIGEKHVTGNAVINAAPTRAVKVIARAQVTVLATITVLGAGMPATRTALMTNASVIVERVQKAARMAIMVLDAIRNVASPVVMVYASVLLEIV
jgi:hypothetical protein